MSVPTKLDPRRVALVVVDVQEAFRKVLPDFDEVASGAVALIRGADILGVPVVITEQYPKGLGETVPEVAEHLPDGAEPIEKVCFSAAAADGFDLGDRDQALVCGIETHVCVHQTVMDLLGQGVEVHLARDAVGSRSAANKEVGLERAEESGAVPTSVETALFELLGQAGTDEFKQVQKVVLDFAPNP